MLVDELPCVPQDWYFEPTKQVIETAHSESPAYRDLLVSTLSDLLSTVSDSCRSLTSQHQLRFGNSRFGGQRLMRMHPYWVYCFFVSVG